MDASEAVKRFNEYLKSHQHKLTKQRALITEIFFDPKRRSDHPTVEELYLRVKAQDSNVGHATIYRTLKLLVEAGLAMPNRISEGLTRYEPEIPGVTQNYSKLLFSSNLGKKVTGIIKETQKSRSVAPLSSGSH